MVNVTSSYKLITLIIDKKPITVRINTSDAWNVFEAEFENRRITVNEGDIIEFVTENGEAKKGTVVKINGKKDKTKIQIIPEGMEYEEIWPVAFIKEGTLKNLNVTDEVIEPTENEENDEDEE